MKILMVAIPNHHFFQWVNQLKDSGYEVYWFDITDGAGFSEKIGWVKQFNGWKLKWNYPFRYAIKKRLPKLHLLLERLFVNKTAVVFEKIMGQVQPDMVHCFEMKLAGLPILAVMQKNKLPFVYSSWGSDLYDYQNLGVTELQVKSFLKRTDYLITDCKRDHGIASDLGFANTFLGVFPGNGGIEINHETVKTTNQRSTICIKGYEDGVGKAIVVLKAIENLQLKDEYDFLVFSADKKVKDFIQNSAYFNSKKVEVISRNSFIQNHLLLQKFGNCLLYIGNSSSDGMPNSLLESMAMGVFPIQSNPGNVTEEVIVNGKNGYLIQDPDDTAEVARHILNALGNTDLIENAGTYNFQFIAEHYNRRLLKDKIVSLYKYVLEPN